MDAAHRDSFEMTGATMRGTRYRETSMSQTPEWLRRKLLHTLAAWDIAQASTCLHDPSPKRPEPVFAVAWKPRLVVCAHCQHLLQPTTREMDTCCDRCGHICAGVDAADPIYPIAVVYNQLSFRAGVCTGCKAGG